MDMNDLSPTNSLVCASFDVFKMDAVEDPLINVNKLATMDIEESYVALAVGFIKEQNKAITDSKIILYHALSEASEYGVVLESFSEFFSKIKEIIDKFLYFIKSLFQRFMTTLMKMVSSDKYIIKHKKDFNNFKSSDEFDYTGFVFTFRPGIPTEQPIYSFTADLFDEFKNSITSGAVTKQGFKSNVDNMDLEASYDEFRAEVLGITDGTKIYNVDFGEELFKIFRNGELDSEDIEITSSEVRNSLYRFENYKKVKKEIERNQRDVEKAYDNLKKEVQEITKRNGDLSISAIVSRFPNPAPGSPNPFNITSIDGKSVASDVAMPSDFMVVIDSYIKKKCDQIAEFSNIHVLAFSYKLDALKDCYKQDRNILYTALSRIQRSDSKRKEDWE